LSAPEIFSPFECVNAGNIMKEVAPIFGAGGGGIKLDKLKEAVKLQKMHSKDS
jgi:hypothetical protein